MFPALHWRRDARRSACPAPTPSVARLENVAGSPQRRARNFDMRAAAAQIVAQCLKHLFFRRLRRSREQRLRRDDHAVEAVAALCGLLGDEGLLHWVGMLARAKTLERHDV